MSNVLTVSGDSPILVQAPRAPVAASAAGAPAANRTAMQHLAASFLQGDGIEIGALHNPILLPAGCNVRYVDRMSNRELRAHYPELNALPIVEPDIIDNGETLATIGTCRWIS